MASAVVPNDDDGDSRANTIELHKVETDKFVVQKLLECPICFEICIPPIFVCDTGHHVCNKCHEQIQKCGICTAGFRGTRNFFLENYFETSCSFTCYFSKDGCNDIIPGFKLAAHKITCDYRPVHCVYRRCENEAHIPFSLYLDHIQNVHSIWPQGDCSDDGEIMYEQIWYDQDLTCDQDDGWPPCVFRFFGFTFIGMSEIKKSTVGSWVTIVGSTQEANKFRVQITLESTVDATSDEDAPKSYMRWEGPVHPIHSSGSSIMDEAKCMLTSIHFIQSICKKRKTREQEQEETAYNPYDSEGELEELDTYWTVKFKLVKK